VYFDFNNFKAYNDRYGFRQGDRALHLFAQILVRKTDGTDAFCGHVGGDDFFLGLRNLGMDDVLRLVSIIVETFRSDVESFYDPETIRKGFITARDRNGEITQFPLMTISSAVICLPGERSRVYSLENISSILAVMKKRSKCCPSGLCCLNLAELENQPFSEFDFIDDYLNRKQSLTQDLEAVNHALAVGG